MKWYAPLSGTLICVCLLFLLWEVFEMSCMDFQDAGPYQIYPLGFWGVQYATIPCVFFFFLDGVSSFECQNCITIIRVYQGIRFRSPSSALSPLIKTLKHASSMSEFHDISWVAIGGNALRIGFTESLQWVWAPLWIGKWATAESLPIWMNLSGDGWSGFRGGGYPLVSYHNDGKSHFLWVNPQKMGHVHPFSIAMLVYQRVLFTFRIIHFFTGYTLGLYPA